MQIIIKNNNLIAQTNTQYIFMKSINKVRQYSFCGFYCFNIFLNLNFIGSNRAIHLTTLIH